TRTTRDAWRSSFPDLNGDDRGMSIMPARQVPQKPRAAPSAPAAGTHPEQPRLRAITLELLERRGRDKTICPSDAARALAGKNFRPLMDAARAAAAELVAGGAAEGS